MEKYEIDEILSNIGDYLEMKGYDTSKLITCINPNHTDKNPSMKVYKNKCHCFGCDKTYNLIDVISIIENIDNKTAFKRAIEYYGNHTMLIKRESAKINTNIKNKEYNIRDYSNAYKFWKKKLQENTNGQEYLASRGISLETALKFNLGFNVFTFNNMPFPAITIPLSKSCYTARFIDNNEFRYFRPEKAHVEIFNKDILNSKEDNIFICEGEFDALSILECNASAISLNGVNNLDRLYDVIKKEKTYILALDNDTAGENKKQEFIDYCLKNNIKYKTLELGEYKDVNDLLVKNKVHLEKTIKSLINEKKLEGEEL